MPDTEQTVRQPSHVVGQVRTTTDITAQRLADLMVTAVEGYLEWGTIVSGDYQSLDFRFHLAPDESLRQSLNEEPDWGVAVKHLEGQHTQLVTPEVLLVGLQVAADRPEYRQHWLTFLDENEDAITGDVILQLALFGEVVFG